MAESPTFARRQLGAALKSARLAKGLTVEQVATKIRNVATTVRRWESGASGVSGPALLLLCSIYDVPEDQQAVMEALSDQSKQPVWWASYGLPTDYRDLIGLEVAADEMCVYEPQFVTGLLQTEDYARALIAAGGPQVSAEVVDARVAVRVRRQEVLTRDKPLQLKAVLDESALMRPIGGRDVAVAQLDHLAKMAGERHVSVQILPYDASGYGHAGSFALLNFPKPAPPVVYVEAFNGDLYPDAEAVNGYIVIHDNLRTAAASREQSLKLIKRARDAMARS